MLEKKEINYELVNGKINCKGDVNISSCKLTHFPIPFGVVIGAFYCYNNQLTTLEGAPERVGGYFSCSNNQLTTLEGAPREVDGYFNCSYNQLTTLEGAPEKVGKDFDCSNNQLTTLEGAPREVGGNFYCYNNPKLPKNAKLTTIVKGEIKR